MAKKPATIVAREHKIEDFAADLGKMLGHARSKAEGWLGQRATIVRNLTALRDEATKLLSDLGHDAAVAGGRGRKAFDKVVGRKPGPGRPAGSKNGVVRKKRTMSAQARKAISDAQKKRWAAQKAAEKK